MHRIYSGIAVSTEYATVTVPTNADRQDQVKMPHAISTISTCLLHRDQQLLLMTKAPDLFTDLWHNSIL